MGRSMRRSVRWMWVIMVLGLWPTLARPAPVEPVTQVTAISVPELDFFDGPKGQRIESVPKDRVRLPIPVLKVEPNKRLKLRLPDGREVWVEGSAVKTNKAQGTIPCDPAAKTPTVLGVRSLGEGCK